MKILFISSNAPWPATGGDRQRTDLLYRALSALGEVDFLLCRPRSACDEPGLQRLREHYRLVAHLEPPPRGSLGRLRHLRALAPRQIDALSITWGSIHRSLAPVPRLAAQLRAQLAVEHYDLIVSRYTEAATACAAWLEKPLMIDVDDYLPQVYAQRLEQPLPIHKRLTYRHRLTQLQAALPPLLNRAQHLWIPNPLDRPAIRHDSVSILPNIPHVAAATDRAGHAAPINNTITAPTADGSPVIGMIGSLSYGVNVQGLEFFLHQIWPGVLAGAPDCRFRIIGSGLSDAQRQRWSQHAGVQVIGFVEDLHQAYAECHFCVVPLQLGGGTKIKVIEALARERTVVLTRASLRGFEHVLHDDDALLVRDEAEHFAAACLSLLQDPARRDQLARRGRALVEEHFSFQGFAGVVASDVQRVVAPAGQQGTHA